MPESEGIVASVSEDGEAEVVIQESELCIHCASEIEVCNCSGVSSRLVINALNSIGASVGDMVSISHKPGALMKSVAIFLVIPAIGLIAGFVTVPILNQSFTMDGIRTALIAAAGLSIGIIVSVLTYRRVSADIQPIISRIIKTGLQVPSSLRVMDPVCKMEVDPATAAGHMTYNGKSYYFCRAGCLETFMKDPAKYGEG
jgi:YHS domain-containing protein/positive regulator of sigma E activity